MQVNVKHTPFPHIIIDDTFDDHQYALIWRELLFLAPKMLSPEMTGASKSSANMLPRKRGFGVFLHDVYTNMVLSDIHTCTRKLFTPQVMDATNSLDMYFMQMRKVQSESILLQIYYNGDYYKDHEDSAVFTIISQIHKTPKTFRGGELFFNQFDYYPKLQNNQTIIFPSVLTHEVTEVKLESDNMEDCRFTISQFLKY
jgi:predicted 2-oxoglutarate/Fe(II)-dependent dioxygenase YbiX